MTERDSFLKRIIISKLTFLKRPLNKPVLNAQNLLPMFRTSFNFLLSLLPLIKFRPLYSYYVPPRLAFLLSALARIILCNISASTRIAWLGPVGFFNFAHVIAIIITISLPFWPFIYKVSMPDLHKHIILG